MIYLYSKITSIIDIYKENTKQKQSKDTIMFVISDIYVICIYNIQTPK